MSVATSLILMAGALAAHGRPRRHVASRTGRGMAEVHRIPEAPPEAPPSREVQLAAATRAEERRKRKAERNRAAVERGGMVAR